MTGRVVTIFFLISNQVLLARRIPPDEYYDYNSGSDAESLEALVIGLIIGLVWSIKMQLANGKTPTIGITLFMAFFLGICLTIPIGILIMIFT